MDPLERQQPLHEVDLGAVCVALSEFNNKFVSDELDNLWEEKLSEAEHRYLRDEIGDDEITDDEIEVESLQDRAFSAVEEVRQLAFEYICDQYNISLERTGLALELLPSFRYGPREIEGREIGDGDRFDELAVYFKINKASRFITYMEALRDGNLDEERLEALKWIGTDVLWQLRQDYDLANPSDERSIELLAHISEIVDCFQIIDDDEFVDDLAALSIYGALAKEQILRDFLIAERLGIVDIRAVEITESGVKFHFTTETSRAANWHKNRYTSADEYRKKWTDVVHALKVIAKNTNAKAFLTRLTQNLKEVLQYAKSNPDMIVSGNSSPERSEEEADAFRIVMDESYDALSEVENHF